jgi:hypothetical protein
MPKSKKPIKSYIETNIDADLQINKIEVGANCPDGTRGELYPNR